MGEEITFADVEKLLKEINLKINLMRSAVKKIVLNPSLPYKSKVKVVTEFEKRGFRVVDLYDLPSKERGDLCHSFFAEKYATIR
ncbi:MAG: hypothetical protein QXU17_00050 [Archaeoglobaceae archaeon]